MILTLRKQSHKKSIEKIRASGLVMSHWYLREYGDLGHEFADPVSHYYFIGWKEGKNPNPYFDSSWYLEKIGKSLEDGRCPLLEYIAHQTLVHPSLAFNSKEYSLRYALDGKDPLLHYIETGARAGLTSFPEHLNLEQIKFEVEVCGLFDSEWYLLHYSDVRKAEINPLLHYCTYGWKEGRLPNKYFNPIWYLEHTDHDEVSGVPALLHYVKFGWREGKSPSREFDVEFYLSRNADVLAADIEPLRHYLEYGEREGRERRPIYSSAVCSELLDSGLFLADWYENQYEDLRDAGIDLVEHFVTYGRQEGRNPNPYFDTLWYIKKFGENIPGRTDPIVYYARSGWLLGHSPSARFDAEAYSLKYLDSSTEVEPLRHFLEYGKRGGCQAIPLGSKKGGGDLRLRYSPQATLVDDPALRPLLDRVPAMLRPESNSYNPNALRIHWIIPDFSPGAGGHMTIFRMVRFLEFFGHQNTIWIYNPKIHTSEEDAYDDIVKYFQVIKGDVNFVDQKTDFGEGDIIFATDWSSVSFALSASNFKRRFYFVQDHEPEFYPQGSKSILAKMTYSEDLDCVCASPWLRGLMEESYGRWARDFWLAVDQNIYHPGVRAKIRLGRKKIAFYARHFTSRRAVELGFLALETLAKNGADIEVHCFGAELPFDEAPFGCIDHGVLTPEELAALYRDCDLGIVFSATNYSLIPQEMMACGLPVAELDGESTRAIFPADVVSLLNPNPVIMAEQLSELLSDEALLTARAKSALDWVTQFTWEESAKNVESAILDRLGDFGFIREVPVAVESELPKASVIIPTWNGGDVFRRVIKMLEQQRTPWPYEILVVDSGSQDGTVEFVKSRLSIKLHQIPNAEFQHGRTRNLAASLTSGEYIAVLTQDALPKDEFWLYNLVTHLEHFPEAAGAFGKHLAWPDADPFTKRDLERHFKEFFGNPICVSRDTNPVKWADRDLQWQQFLHFYSDNNSCMRRSVWEKIPYPDIDFGEDQAWAWEVIKAGYSKVYACEAVVYHSHNFDEGDIEKRSFEEGKFFRNVFGYEAQNMNDIENTISILDDLDEKWGRDKSLSDQVIESRKSANRLRVVGYHRAYLESSPK